LIDWIRNELQVVEDALFKAYLFGSALDASRIPRDVDVVFVTTDGAGESKWQLVRVWRDDITPRFLAEFGIPLSAMVVTPSEWIEIDNVIVRERLSLL
jgi:predicted nucleotidyltransferase